MRLSPDIRGLFRKLVRKGLTVTHIAYLFDTTRQTVYRWLKRGKHVGRESFKDRPREPKGSKVTDEVELFILTLRNTFEWGASRIQQSLYTNFLPSSGGNTLRARSQVIQRDHKQHKNDPDNHEFKDKSARV